MATIAAADVKKLRDQTGAGMMDCKKVLLEAEGNFDKAVDLLRERGLGKARGKAGRATSEGRIAAAVSGDGRRGALVEVNCETDFVARTDDFEALCNELAAAARDGSAGSPEEMLNEAAGEGTWNDLIVGAIAKLGENIQLNRLDRIEAGGKGLVSSYIHAGGKIGALVEVEADDPSSDAVRSLAHNVCMHIAASAPGGVSRDDLPAEEVERERGVLRAQAESEGKPANVVEKMVEGRLSKFFKEVVLLEQPLVMDPDLTVQKAAEAAGGKVIGFRRYQLGEEAAG